MVALPDSLNSATAVVVSPTAPPYPWPGLMWANPDTGEVQIWLNGAWAPVGAGAGGLPAPPAGEAGQWVFWGTGTTNTPAWRRAIDGGIY